MSNFEKLFLEVKGALQPGCTTILLTQSAETGIMLLTECGNSYADKGLPCPYWPAWDRDEGVF